jgi:hypothetical protein
MDLNSGSENLAAEDSGALVVGESFQEELYGFADVGETFFDGFS